MICFIKRNDKEKYLAGSSAKFGSGRVQEENCSLLDYQLLEERRNAFK